MGSEGEGLEAGGSNKPGEPLESTGGFESVGLENWDYFSEGHSGSGL